MRKRLLRALSLKIFPFFGALLIKLLYATTKKVWHLPSNIPDEPMIFVCWHGDLLMQPYSYFKLRKKPNAKVIISEHFDGLIIAKIMTFFSLGSIHGSSTRNGARVLISALRHLREGFDIAITPDGPKGPRHVVQDGVVVLAQKSRAKVVILSMVPSKYWQLKSWDKFTIVKPFTTINMYASEPLDLSTVSHKEGLALIQEHLLKHDY